MGSRYIWPRASAEKWHYLIDYTTLGLSDQRTLCKSLRMVLAAG